LDYTGGAINEGSKLFVAVSGAPRRDLAGEIPPALRAAWPDHWGAPRVVSPGIVAFRGAGYGSGVGNESGQAELARQLEIFTARLRDAGLLDSDTLDRLPLWVLCDDPDFAAADF